MAYKITTKQVLADAATVIWDYRFGSIAEVTIMDNRTLSITNLPTTPAFGVLNVKHGIAGKTLNLGIGTSAVAFAWSAGLNAVTEVSFIWDGITIRFNSTIFPTP